MTELSDQTRRHVHTLFRAADRVAAEQLLVLQCGDQLPGMAQRSPIELERIRFAALRLSRGRLPDLAKAVQLAQTDWRDLLVAADFANDPAAHLSWSPSTEEAE